MAEYYRCYLFDKEGRLVSRLDIRAHTNEEALGKAREAYANREEKFGYELWLATSLLHKEL